MAPHPLDAYPPDQVASLVAEVGVRKARQPALQLATLGVLAGAFIALGAAFHMVTVTGSGLGFGPTRLVGGLAFSLGLILVIVGGAELFTGNSLIVMAWAEGRISTAQLLRNWAIVYAANLVGAVGTAVLAHAAGVLAIGDGAVGETAAAIARSKVSLDPTTAFFRGILCNVLVCLAVWLSFAAGSVTGKVLAIVFPITAFVALGLEHSVANMYLIPLAMLADAEGVTLGGFAANLACVTLGNVVGGGLLVGLVYWAAYLRHPDRRPETAEGPWSRP
jgi:formate/nitrite transporter